MLNQEEQIKGDEQTDGERETQKKIAAIREIKRLTECQNTRIEHGMCVFEVSGTIDAVLHQMIRDGAFRAVL